jgi:hypothetical protein
MPKVQTRREILERFHVLGRHLRPGRDGEYDGLFEFDDSGEIVNVDREELAALIRGKGGCGTGLRNAYLFILMLVDPDAEVDGRRFNMLRAIQFWDGSNRQAFVNALASFAQEPRWF